MPKPARTLRLKSYKISATEFAHIDTIWQAAILTDILNNLEYGIKTFDTTGRSTGTATESTTDSTAGQSGEGGQVGTPVQSGAEGSERVAEQAETPAEQEEQSTGQAEQPAPLTEAQKQVASGLLGVSDEARNQELQEQKRQEPLKARAKECEARTGVKVNAISSIDEVSNKQARKAIESGETVFGWFEPKTGMVCIYLPHVPNESEIDKTYIHEVVSHKGLRELLGERNFERIKRQAEREGEHILVLPSSVEEEAGALPGRPSDLSSEDKDREKSTESNTSTSEETPQPTEAQKDVLGRVFGMSPEEVEKEHKARKSRKKDNELGKKIEDFGETIAGARTGRGVYLRSKYEKPERPASPFQGDWRG